jgi:thioredoxin-related protein
MIRMKRIICILLIIPLMDSAQTTKIPTPGSNNGILFESNLSWGNVVARAKAENKYIFLDCYTTWCGPCKYMRDQVFVQRKVGDYFNEHFINVAVQLDKTSKDSANIQSWYAAADSVKKIYKIAVYPTFLFFSPDGIAVHRFVGSTENGEDFVCVAKDVFDSTKQYYSILEQWKHHKSDSGFLLQAIQTTLDGGDEQNARAIGESFLDCLNSPITENNIQLFSKLMYSPGDKYFELFLNNPNRINGIMNDSVYAQSVLESVIFHKKIEPLLETKGYKMYWAKIATDLRRKYSTLGDNFIQLLKGELEEHIFHEITNDINKYASVPDWKQIEKELRDKYPGYDLDHLLMLQEVRYYGEKKQWANCESTAFLLFNKFGNKVGFGAINYISWNYLFLHSDKRKILVEAAKWMRYGIDKKEPDKFDYEKFDTYANLLYKIGKKEDALVWESKAIDTISKRNPGAGHVQDFKADLKRMEKGEQTWNEMDN